MILKPYLLIANNNNNYYNKTLWCHFKG